MSETIRVLNFNKKNFQKKSLKILQIKILFLYLHKEIKQDLFEFLIRLELLSKGRQIKQIQKFKHFTMEEKKLNSVENVDVVENSSKEKVNKVSAKKAKATAKANSTIKLSVDSIFKDLNEKTNGLLKTSLGGKKTEIYVESLFAELNEKQKKTYRKKLRNTTFSLLDSVCKAKEEKKQNELKTLVSAFKDFYKQVYKIHDFSFASIASENTKDTKKEVLTKGLNIVKNFK